MVDSMQVNRINNFIAALRRIFIKAMIVFLLLEMTTYGWAASEPEKTDLSLEKQQIKLNLEKTVVHLSQTIGIRNYHNYHNLNLTADYISSQFRKMGFIVEEAPYLFEGKEYRNIVAERSSSNKGQGVIIIGAHYDSCFNPGADDNASGVAGMLELARLLKDVDTKNNLRFVAFVNEEPPFFKTKYMGSFVYASGLRDKGETIKAAVILESIGFYSEKRNSQRYPPLFGLFYPNKGNYIAVVSNFPSRAVMKTVLRYFKKTSKIPVESITAPGIIPGIDFSDHGSFWRKGYHAVMVTDTAYLRNKNYHKPTDLPGTLNYEKMTEVILGLKGAMTGLANNEGL